MNPQGGFSHGPQRLSGAFRVLSSPANSRKLPQEPGTSGRPLDSPRTRGATSLNFLQISVLICALGLTPAAGAAARVKGDRLSIVMTAAAPCPPHCPFPTPQGHTLRDEYRVGGEATLPKSFPVPPRDWATSEDQAKASSRGGTGLEQALAGSWPAVGRHKWHVKAGDEDNTNAGGGL